MPLEKASQIDPTDHTSPFLVYIHSTYDADDDHHYFYVTVRRDDRNRLILRGCSKDWTPIKCIKRRRKHSMCECHNQNQLATHQSNALHSSKITYV